MKRSAFTMVELIFVIVVLGILAAVAIPKLAATRADAQISAAKATVAALRSGVVSWKQQRMLQGTLDCTNLSDLSSVLAYQPDVGSVSTTAYSVTIEGHSCTFTLDKTNCTVDLTAGAGDDYCEKID